MLSEVKRAIKLREEGKLTESNEILVKSAEKYPKDSGVNYQCAWSFDILGLEKEAVPYYEKAIMIGLNDEDLKGALLGLGSTYRILGQYEKSKEVLEKGLSLFPGDRAIKVFYSMTLYNLKEFSRAMEILLVNIAGTSSDENIVSYKKAIEYYADKLDEVL